MRYSKYVSTKNTPQSEPIPGQNMIKNNAGGYTFETSMQSLLERFLILGTEGGTYYTSEQKLTVDTSKTIIAYIKSDGIKVLQTVAKVLNERSVPRVNPSLFVLALCATFGDNQVKSKTYSYIPDLCSTATHLFTFCQFIQDLRGWSRGLRTAVGKWYLNKTNAELAYQLVKYRQRDGWTHRDVLRLSHPKAINAEQNLLLKYAVGKLENLEEMTNPHILGYEKARTSLKGLPEIIREHRLSWEMLPTDSLNEKEVQAALVDSGMPLNALMRNLNRFTKSNLLVLRTGEYTKKVVQQLQSGRSVHPVNVLNAYKVYSRGYGFRGEDRWQPNAAISDALMNMFENSFKHAPATRKKLLVAVDVSGSMQAQISNMALSAAEASAALAMTFLQVEENVDVVYFNTKTMQSPITKRSSYEEVLNSTRVGGGTDCASPIDFATANKTKYDGIIILTDNETWSGSKHPYQSFRNYRDSINKDVKSVIIAMTSTSCELFPDDEVNTLNVAGFDSSIPQIVYNFLK